MQTLDHLPAGFGLQPYYDAARLSPERLDEFMELVACDFPKLLQEELIKDGFCFDSTPPILPAPTELGMKRSGRDFSTGYRSQRDNGLYLADLCEINLRHLLFCVAEPILNRPHSEVPDLLRVINRLCQFQPQPGLYVAKFLNRLSDYTYHEVTHTYERYVNKIYKLLGNARIHEIGFNNLNVVNPFSIWVEGEAQATYEKLLGVIPFAKFSVRPVFAVYLGRFITEFDEQGKMVKDYSAEVRDFSAEAHEIRTHALKRKLNLLIAD